MVTNEEILKCEPVGPYASGMRCLRDYLSVLCGAFYLEDDPLVIAEKKSVCLSFAAVLAASEKAAELEAQKK